MWGPALTALTVPQNLLLSIYIQWPCFLSVARTCLLTNCVSNYLSASVASFTDAPISALNMTLDICLQLCYLLNETQEMTLLETRGPSLPSFCIQSVWLILLPKSKLPPPPTPSCLAKRSNGFVTRYRDHMLIPVASCFLHGSQ